MFMLDGKPLSLDRAFTTADGTQYPANWLRLASQEERAAIGVTEAAEPEPYDQRFYWAHGVPKLLDDREEVDQDGNPVLDASGERLVTKGLKSQWTSQVKHTAGTMLAQTDWMVTRKFERNVDISADVVAHRAAILAEAERLESAISTAVDVEGLIVVVSSQNWPQK
jgi:hypothetical protein